MKSVLWVTTAGFFLLSWWWYVCPHKKVCPFGSPVPSATVSPPVALEAPDVPLGRLLFGWDSQEPITSAAFPTYRDSILSLLSDNDQLEIVGGYYADEANSTSFADLGLARAYAIRALFPELADNRFSLKSTLFEKEMTNERVRPFLASIFRRIVVNESVREVEGRMVINFPHASDEMLSNVKLNQYLDDLAANLKTNNARVNLVGHTDNTSSAASNMRLGLKRANAIRNLLVRKGLDAARITVESKGEEQPIATNETADGRQENRRVELTVIP